MTELFGRLAPGADLEAARAELRAVHGAMVKEHPEAYSPKADFRIDAVRLRDQITSRGADRAAGAARGVGAGLRHRLLERRQPDPGAHGAARRRAGDPRGARRQHRRALRRTLLAESLLLCGAGAAARRADRAADGGDPGALRFALLGARARSHGRFQHALGRRRCWRWSRRCCWPSCRGCRRRDASQGFGLASGSVRITGGTSRRLRLFAVTQIAASFVLLAGAEHAARRRCSRCRRRRTGFDTRHVLAMNVPVMSYGRTPEQIVGFYKEAMRRIGELPGVDRVAVGTLVPWRDAGSFGPGFQFSAEGHVRRRGEEDPARAVPHGFARLLRRARRAASSPAAISTMPTAATAESGRHRQPEPGAAACSRTRTRSTAT